MEQLSQMETDKILGAVMWLTILIVIVVATYTAFRGKR